MADEVEEEVAPIRREPIRLPEEVKRRIVRELACFRKASEIITILKEEYDITHLERRYLHYFDASKDYCLIGEPLKKLFKDTRKEFVEGHADLYVSHQSYRLRKLQSLAEQAEAKGQIKLAADLLKQAAEDFGGLFTNVRHMTGQFDHQHMSVEDARDKVAAARARLQAKGAETLQ